MGRLWTSEEKKIVHNMMEQDEELLYEDIAEALRDDGFNDRTAEAVRCMLRRERAEKAPKKKDNNIAIPGKLKILYYDIETTDLSASFGELMMMGYRWHHENKYRIVHMYDFEGWDDGPVERRDRQLVEHVSAIVAEADVLVGHYSTKFDHLFIQTRCLVHGLPPIPDTVQIDTWSIARYQLKLNNNRLKTLAEALNCENQKSKVPAYIWRRAKAHDLDAMKIISKYCLQDVRTQYDVTQKVLPIAKNMPNWNLLVDEVKFMCPSCGSDDVVQRGYRYTKIHKYKRMQCKNCGKWMRGRTTTVPRNVERLMY
jgi:DNA polymerase elongation subunit (family B)